MSKIHEVAKRAGVAPITVSRVINSTGYISEKTRLKVEEAIREVGYVPNVVARSLRIKRTKTLALVITDITNPFFTIVARGVEDTANEAGYSVFFCNTDESEEKEEKYIQLILQKQVDGILLVPAKQTANSVNLVINQRKPIVILDRWIPTPVDIVQCDSEGGAYQLVNLLLNLGHKHIVMINGPDDVSTSIERMEGYRRAMRENGLMDYEQVHFGKFNQSSGYEITKRIIQQNPKPTAIFAANNLIALGTLMALDNLGLHVPQDVAVVGFDDLPPNLVVNPILTVASQPAYEMGRKATQLLLERLENKNGEECLNQVVKLPVELIVRSSSGGKIISNLKT